MDNSGLDDVLLFEGFQFNCHGGCLFRLNEAGAAEPVLLGSRSLALLRLLLERAGEVVAKDEIMEIVWPGRAVEPANLNVQIAKLRHIIDLGREQHSCIQTVTGYGYRFIAQVRHVKLGADAISHAISNGGVLQRPCLSIVVLPFRNLSGNREEQFFADGITEDLTTDLSRIESIFVVSCTTAFTYTTKVVETRQIGRELGVRYVLEGSVRRCGQQLRVNTQLIDAETDVHLWAERFDGDALDLFALEDKVASKVVMEIRRRRAMVTGQMS
jgi:TolB-like protein